ncbi:PEP/pyruvate-binding domain-containing protein [Desulfobacca acetoxidans]
MFKFFRRFLKEAEDDQVHLQEKFNYFRRLLDNNNLALATMADMEEKLSGNYLFDTGYLKTQVDLLGTYVREIISALNQLTQNRYQELVLVHQKIQAVISQDLTAVPSIPATPYILPISEINHEMAASCGGKMANLGEIRNRLHLPVPSGFAITAAAYQRFLEGSSLSKVLQEKLSDTDITDLAGLERVSRELQESVLQADVPVDLAATIRKAVPSLGSRYISVRSSAVGEDEEFSFAGQFATLLHVDPADLIDHYRAVVASKFTSRAIFYWKYQRFSLNELPMAVGCLEMIPAQASGVMFTVDPQAPYGNRIIISAVWGLGKFAVDGTVSPDIYEVGRESTLPVYQRRIATKGKALRCQEGPGVEEIVLPPDQAQAPCLDDRQIKELAAMALQLEKHFGRPQDIEWATDQHGSMVILQSRPLRVMAAAFSDKAEEREVSTWEPIPPLLRFGIRAVGGVAAGPVYIVRREEEIVDIPSGVVVVARQPSARLVLVMNRIAAIITEVGSPTDHMTIIAREFRVPTLVEVGGALRTLQQGQMVTVDADAARVYPGVLPELLTRERRSRKEDILRGDPIFQKLRQILKKTTPLNLLDPTGADFNPNHCQTLHDITRFCHEKAMDAMFALDVEQSVKSSGVCRLKSDLPLNLFILDLGGGLAVKGKSVVEESDITSRPFLAVLRGFHHPQIRWAGQVSVDFKGFMSVFANTLYDMNKADTDLGGKSFAIITDTYLNFNSRLGYHFGILDAYVSSETNENYISFQFKGGAANIERRERRARLLSLILSDLGFKSQAVGDMVRARLVKYSLMETEEILESVGNLLAFSRQLDLALSSDAVIDRLFQAFKERDFSLSFINA